MKLRDEAARCLVGVVLLTLLLVCSARGQASFGGLLGETQFSAEANGTDVLTISSAVPARATLVVFETFEALSTMTSAALINASNYPAVLLGTQMDDDVHRQSVYSLYCPNGLAAGATIGMSYDAPAYSSRAYALIYLTGVSPSAQPDAVYIGQSYGSSIKSPITTTNKGCIIVGMATTDGTPTNATGSSASYISGGMTMIGNLATNIGFVPFSTAGLISAYYYTNTSDVGTYTNVSLWTTNGLTGPVAKSEEDILVAFNSITSTNPPIVTSPVTSSSSLATSSSSVTSGNYYVDYVNGNDTNSGTSPDAPWQHCPGDSNAVAVADSATLSPGNTVYFKGGVTYVGEIDINASGAPGNPITFDGNSSGTWGSGMAAIDCSYQYYHAFAALHLVSSRDHIVIKNFDISHLKNVSNATQTVNTVQGSLDGPDTTNTVAFAGDNGVYSYGGIFIYGNDWVVQNCNLHESQQWWYRDLAVGNPVAPVPCLQAGIDIYGGTNVIITNCAVWDIGRDCLRETGTNLLVTGCNFGGPSSVNLTNRGWFAVAVRGYGYLVGSAITHCIIHDGWQLGGDEAAQRCHAGDWIHLYGNNDGVMDGGDPIGMLIDSCLMYNDQAFAYANGTANIYLEEDTWNTTIRNCLFINPQHMGVWTSGGAVSNVALLNNTFVCFNHASSAGFSVYISATSQAVNITNNVIVQLSPNSAVMPMVVLSPTNGNVASDFNLYYNPLTALYGTVRYLNIDRLLPVWQLMTGNDTHSLILPPIFVNLPVSGATSSSGNYNLAINSPGLAAGLNLSGIFTSDYTGNLRSLAGAWDMGAYQYGTNGLAIPLPPTNVKVISQ